MIEWINHSGISGIRILVNSTIQDSVFLVIVFIVIYMLRHTSAQYRYNILLLGLIQVLIPPFITVSPWKQALPQTFSIVSNIDTMNVTAKIPFITSTTPLSLSWIGIIFSFWMIISILILSVHIISSIQLRLLLRSSFYLDSIQYGRSTVKLFKHPAIKMPIIVGLFPGTIHVPDEWEQWDPQCRKMILDHELAHVRRYDSVIQIIQVFIKTVYFFNPLVWLLNKKLNEYREMACDDMSVAERKDAAIEYSRYLVNIAESMVRSDLDCSSATALIRQKNNLMNRIKYQMTEVPMLHKSTKKYKLLAFSLLFLIIPLSLNFINATTEKEIPEKHQFIRLVIQNDSELMIINKYVRNQEKFSRHYNASLGNLEQILDKVAQPDRNKVLVEIMGNEYLTMQTVKAIHEILIQLDLIKVTFRKTDGSDIGFILPGKSDRIFMRTDDIKRSQLCRVQINNSNDIIIDDNSIPLQNVKNHIEKELAQTNDLLVTVYTSDDTPFTDYITVLEKIKQAGALKIVIHN